MKSRIANLTPLEKNYLLIGSIVFSILFFYFGLLSPLKNTVVTLRHTVKNESALLAWVKNADKHISCAMPTNAANYHSLLSDVQNDIQTSSLAKHLTLFKQGNNDSVVVKFDKVSFDSFSNWLSNLLKAKQLKIAELNVIAIDKKGVVDMELTLIK